MYVPHAFAEHDLPTLFGFIEAHPLATLVTSSATDGLLATHLPLVLDRAAGPMGTLLGHVARANPHSRRPPGGAPHALVIFSGPDAYITPAWYATKHETGRVVPTWNYVAVHAYGTLELRDDRQFLRANVEALVRLHEGTRPTPWQVSDAPAEYIDQQLKAIMGIELRIDRLEGKWKMSQNRPAADIDGVIQGLRASEAERDRTVAEIVRQRRPDQPHDTT